MGIISKTVKVFPRGKSIAYYKEKGYDAKYNQELEVKVEDLSFCSTALVETKSMLITMHKQKMAHKNVVV